MGEVWRARDRQSGELRAVKILKSAQAVNLAGDLDRAEEEARRAIETGRAPWQWFFMATLADVLLARGLSEEALEVVRPAHAAVASGHHAVGEAKIRLVFAKALAAKGDVAAARDVITTARERLLDRAARISNSDRRRRFLECVPENERTLVLARGSADP